MSKITELEMNDEKNHPFTLLQDKWIQFGCLGYFDK